MRDLFNNVFRLNPCFTITAFRELTQKQRMNYQRFIKDRRYYAFLHAPTEAKLTVKAINRDLALFLEQLIKPQIIGALLQKSKKGIRAEEEQFIIRLILDGVLEAQIDDNFQSGLEAIARVLPSGMMSSGTRTSRSEKSRIQVLSEEAISFALSSALTQPRDLSFLLYNFNRIPLSRRWQSDFPSESAVSKFLDLNEDGFWPGMPARVRVRSVRKGDDGQTVPFDRHWRVWQLKKRARSRGKPSYKVYVSPVPRELPAVFRMVRAAAVQSEAHAMKIGRNVSGILRADKLLVYFFSYKAALNFASEISKKTISFRRQGTPFTFQINSCNELVSMGVDPPMKFSAATSWRLYITNKLCLAIQNAQRTRAKNPLGHIQAYMRMIGVDSINWCPISKNWKMAFKMK